jgi:BirA family transcriptional regulator, biotin operon repressor / biotin---[acetyl-CoA-carboxylase] ligase
MNILYFKKLDSTNKYAKENIDNLDDKTIISTDIQTNGYGQFERNWIDLGEENIYMTFVLKPSEEFLPVYKDLTNYLAQCTCKVIEKFGISSTIKPPNDILINGKKVCGILAQTVTRGHKSKGVVLGIGINLNASAKNLAEIDIPATSLNLETGNHINKKEFINDLIELFFAGYNELFKCP